MNLQIFAALQDFGPSGRTGEDRREAEGAANDCVSGLQDHGPSNHQNVAHKSQSGHQEFITKHFPCILIRDCPCYTELDYKLLILSPFRVMLLIFRSPRHTKAFLITCENV